MAANKKPATSLLRASRSTPTQRRTRTWNPIAMAVGTTITARMSSQRGRPDKKWDIAIDPREQRSPPPGTRAWPPYSPKAWASAIWGRPTARRSASHTVPRGPAVNQGDELDGVAVLVLRHAP